MYQNLLNSYFISKEYTENEKDKDYLKLIVFLKSNLKEEQFLECEELLNTALINKTENAFLYGCTAAANCLCR